jgi:hypothetical protein
LLLLNAYNAVGQSLQFKSEKDPIVFVEAFIPGSEDSIFNADNIAATILHISSSVVYFPF